MSNIQSLILFLLLGWITTLAVFASEVENLYAANVPVADRSKKELEKAVGMALKAVLIKVTGNAKGAGEAAGVLVDGAMSLLEQYSYVEEADGEKLQLLTKFDQSILNNELAILEIPVWGKERPDTFVGLFIENGAETQWLHHGTVDVALVEPFLIKAKERGLPLVLPTIQDGSSFLIDRLPDGPSSLAINELYEDIVSEYATPCVLIGSLRRVAPDIWEADWNLRIENVNYEWQSEGDLLDLTVFEIVDVVTDRIATSLVDARFDRDLEEIEIMIVGLDRSADFLKVIHYLSGLDSVKQVLVRSVRDGSIKLIVSAPRGRRELQQSIAFGNFLNVVSEIPIAYSLNSGN